MKKINEFVEELKKQTKAQIREKMKSDSSAYEQLMEDLMVQGLIKMMEAKLYIRCRECDVSVLQGVQSSAIAKYREMMVKEVKRFEGMSPDDIPCELIYDKNYLDSVEDNEMNGIIGGFKMFGKGGRIVCSQTIDDRIDLCFQAAIPAIRHMLFPSMRKETK